MQKYTFFSICQKTKKSGSHERLFPYLQLLTYEKKLLLL